MYILAVHSLQGALGRTSGRSYKAAPRQLLQVDDNGTSPSTSPVHADHSPGAAAAHAAKLGKEALGTALNVSASGFVYIPF
jgi:DNA topoisomerase 2-associated protein PAT1